MGKKRKTIIKIFKKANFKKADFLDVTLNLQNDTYRPYKKPNDKLFYIHSSSNHLPQIIKQLPNSISKRLSKNSFNHQIFNIVKVENVYTLKRSGYNVDLKYTNNKLEKLKTRKRNIIWFKPPFSKSVSENVAKTFHQLVTKHFPRRHKLHKIIKGHNKKVTAKPRDQRLKCSCGKKAECPMERNCQVNDVAYKCDVTRTLQKKVYLGFT